MQVLLINVLIIQYLFKEGCTLGYIANEFHMTYLPCGLPINRIIITCPPSQLVQTFVARSTRLNTYIMKIGLHRVATFNI